MATVISEKKTIVSRFARIVNIFLNFLNYTFPKWKNQRKISKYKIPLLKTPYIFSEIYQKQAVFSEFRVRFGQNNGIVYFLRLELSTPKNPRKKFSTLLNTQKRLYRKSVILFFS